MKKVYNEDSDLFLEIIRQKISTKNNYFKNNCLHLSSENTTVTELGEILQKQVSEIIAFFWNKGQVISKNQILSFDLLKDYCESINIKIKRNKKINFGEIISEYLQKLGDNSQLVERPPVVSIMGHIDHGKTTLLDTIRQTNLQAKEIGGITQKITVSQIDFQGKKITFLDTPGHSDFIKMRQRGISLTDMVVLVIDASDGIMFQTEEIIDYLHQYQLPAVVFINHKRPEQTDNEANLNRIRSQLQEKGLTPLEWEGETVVVSGSAKKRENVDNLLENILVVADSKSNLRHPANGVVIDHYLHPKTGSALTELLVKDSTIEEKDTIFLNGKFNKVKMIYDLCGKKVAKAFPSDPVQVVGLTSATELGDRFLVINNDKVIRSLENELASHVERENKIAPPPVTKEKKNINLVLLADSQNRLEALTELIKKKDSSECGFWIIHRAIGKLDDSTINLIKITHSAVMAFGLLFNQRQTNIFKENNISFFSSKIIHEIDDKIKEMVVGQQKWEEVEEAVGTSTVIVVIKYSKTNIAGCQVIGGKINRNNQVRVVRGEKEIFQGKIKSLQINKEDKSEVIKGHECGIVLNGFDDFHVGDKIIAFQTIKKNVS